MELQITSKISQNLLKNELETKSTKNAENVLNLIPLDLQETRFRMEWLSKITETRGADKYKQVSKNCVDMKPKSMENRSQNSAKNDAWKDTSKKQKKTQKLTQKWLHKNARILGEIPIGAPLVVQTVFVMKKLSPSAAKVLPRLEKLAKNYPPSAKMRSESRPFSDLGPADCAKRLQ